MQTNVYNPLTAIGASRIEKLHAAYVKGSLTLVTGAGISMAAGLPGWAELSSRVLKSTFAEDGVGRSLEPEEQAAISHLLAQWFDKTSVIDLAREHIRSKRQFHEIMHSALYGKLRPEPQSIHMEIASWGMRHKRRRVFTLNYDTLIEDAITHLNKTAKVHILHSGMPHYPPGREGISIIHIHGALGYSSSKPRGSLVISERDYLTEEDLSWADRRLDDAIEEPNGQLLFVGMSLTDPRIRRHLFRWAHSKKIRDPQRKRVFALLSNESLAPDAPLPERIANRIAREVEPKYWSSWLVDAARIESHAFVQPILRLIRLGTSMRPSIEAAHRQLKDVRKFQISRVRGATAQDNAVIATYLAEQAEFIRRRWSVPVGEYLDFGYFVLDPEVASGELVLAWCHSDRALMGDARVGLPNETPARLRFRLRVANLNRPEGAAGYSFAWGVNVESTGGGQLLDLNFTQEMKHLWNRSRSFNSLWCVPMLDGTEWVPTGVVCLTSNQSSPFWRSLEGSRRQDLVVFLRNTFMQLLNPAS